MAFSGAMRWVDIGNEMKRMRDDGMIVNDYE
jgi:hypothetical protein